MTTKRQLSRRDFLPKTGALDTHALLSNQSQRREIEYRVIGVNSAGISVPSNTAAVVL
jgi:hypothetical protein